MYMRDGFFNLDIGFKVVDGVLKNIKGGRFVNGDGYML